MIKGNILHNNLFLLASIVLFNALVATALHKLGFFSALVLYFVVTIAFLIIIKPHWGLYLAVFLELWFAGFYLFNNYYLRPRLIILPYILIVILLRAVAGRENLELNLKTRNTIIISLLFFLWALCLGIFIHKDNITSVITPMARIGGGIIICSLIPLVITDLQKLKSYLYIMFFAASISAIIGILQIIIGEPFYLIRELFVIATLPDNLVESGRAAGLTFYYIPFSYQILSVLLVSLSILVSTKFTFKKENLFVLIVSVVLFVGLVLSYTRSAIFAACLCMIFMSWSSFEKKKYLIYFLVMISFIIIAVRFFPGDTHRMTTFSDGSSLSRIPLVKMAYTTASVNPWGIGTGTFSEYGKKYYSAVSHLKEASIVLRTSSHNHLLNTLVYYGIPGFLLTICFYIKIFKAIPKGTGKADPLLNSLAKNFPWILVGYLIHSSFHNAGPFVGDNFIWYVIGIVFALSNISEKERNSGSPNSKTCYE